MKLSIIISNRNDLVMLNVTLNSCVEALKSIYMDGEIVLCDNSDDELFKLMPSVIPSGWVKKGLVKLVRQPFPCFTSARHMAVKEAKGEYIFCIDSHVLIGHNTLIDSINFMDRHKDDQTLGFGHPPIRWAHQGPASIKHTLKVSDNGLPHGTWDCAYSVERKMFWKFMPWICRREWFLNTLKGYGTHAAKMLSWGGAELLMQVKSLMLGYNNWAIITDPVIHIGPYTKEIIQTGQYKYRTYTANGNYPHGFGVIVAYAILGGPDAGYAHAKLAEPTISKRHNIKVDAYWPKALEIAQDEHTWLMTNKKIDYLELLKTRPWDQDN